MPVTTPFDYGFPAWVRWQNRRIREVAIHVQDQVSLARAGPLLPPYFCLKSVQFWLLVVTPRDFCTSYIVLPLNISAISPIRAKKEINVAAKIHLGIPRPVTLEPFFLQINAMRRRNKFYMMILHIIEIHIHITPTSKEFTDKKPWAQYRSSNEYFNISNSDVM